MAFTIRTRTLPGSPMLCDYECPEHGRFEQTVQRDASGDPPASIRCDDECDLTAVLCVSAPAIKFWSRDPVPVGRASKGDEKDPRALDTEPLATGKMTRAEWHKWQLGITNERRYQKRIKSGRRSKRIQVGGG